MCLNHHAPVIEFWRQNGRKRYRKHITSFVVSEENNRPIAEVKAEAYADEHLKLADPELANSGYSRHVKMGVHMFNGSDLEEAYLQGYEEGRKDKEQNVSDNI